MKRHICYIIGTHFSRYMIYVGFRLHSTLVLINHHISVYYSFPFIIIYVYIIGTHFSLYNIYVGFRLSNTNTYLSSCVCILSVPISHYIGFTLFLDCTTQICHLSIIYVYIIDTHLSSYMYILLIPVSHYIGYTLILDCAVHNY